MQTGYVIICEASKDSCWFGADRTGEGNRGGGRDGGGRGKGRGWGGEGKGEAARGGVDEAPAPIARHATRTEPREISCSTIEA